MSLFDFLAGVFIRRRHPLCHVSAKAGWGCSRGFPAAGAGRICLLPQRLNIELFYGDWHGTVVPSDTVKSDFL
jgi:hypothetical protein